MILEEYDGERGLVYCNLHYLLASSVISKTHAYNVVVFSPGFKRGETWSPRLR